MKKFFSILSFVLMLTCCNFVFTSCGDDDDEEELKEGIDRAILGSWENIDELNECHEIIEFLSDGTYIQMVRDLKEDEDISEYYLDDKLTYAKTKGTYTAINGVMNINRTHRMSFSYHDKEWHENNSFVGNAKYSVTNRNTLSLERTNEETQKVSTITFTKCK